MEINITNHESVSFAESVGISEERSSELSDKLDVLTKGYHGNVVRTCDVVNDIANISINLEEFAYCIINHCNYMMIRHGIFLCPPKK